MVFGDAAFGRWSHERQALTMALAPSEEEEEIPDLSVPCEDTVKRQSSVSQEESSCQNLIMLAPWSLTSSFQSHEEKKKKNVWRQEYFVMAAQADTYNVVRLLELMN